MSSLKMNQSRKSTLFVNNRIVNKILLTFCFVLFVLSFVGCDLKTPLSSVEIKEKFSSAANKIEQEDFEDYIYENFQENLVVIFQNGKIRTNNLSKCTEEFGGDCPTIEKFKAILNDTNIETISGIYAGATIESAIYCEIDKITKLNSICEGATILNIYFYKNSNIKFSIAQINEDSYVLPMIELTIGSKLNVSAYENKGTIFYEFSY